MSDKLEEHICDECGHYWTPSHTPDVCAICGTGSKVVLGSEDDPWADLRAEPPASEAGK